jgi:hypothetical protein
MVQVAYISRFEIKDEAVWYFTNVSTFEDEFDVITW